MNMMDATECFAVPGEDSIVDCINPATGRSWINNETLEQIRERYPNAERMLIEDHCKEKAARQDSPVEWTETTRERYWEMLEVLPPAMYSGNAVVTGFMVGEPYDHHALTGRPRFSGYAMTKQQQPDETERLFECSRPLQRAEFVVALELLATRLLIADAARAIEEIGEDELERAAAQKGVA